LKRGFSFIALDEFARGTNPVEGATLARAVALYFNDKNAVSILTTHYEKVSSPEFCNYQVVGLKNIDFELLRQKIKLESAEPIQIIAERMDYSLQKVNADTELPKDALNICKLLNLSEDILCYCE
jgi:dsDNA-specific endonuclease/ATPase MutS2